MNKKVFLLISLIIVFCAATSVGAQEGFTPSEHPDVFILRRWASGGTVFYVNLPKLGRILMTQVHVLKSIGLRSKLYRGYKFGSFFRVKSRSKDAFELPLTQDVIWKDDVLDVAILRAPEHFEEICHCKGLEIGPFKPGQASLIGYPILGRRTAPKTGKFWTRIGELFGSVEQMTSKGRVWMEGSEALSDIDALSGNSGGPLLDAPGRVIGVIHTMKTWYGSGYAYLNPQISVTPIEKILENINLKRVKQ